MKALVAPEEHQTRLTVTYRGGESNNSTYDSRESVVQVVTELASVAEQVNMRRLTVEFAPAIPEEVQFRHALLDYMTATGSMREDVDPQAPIGVLYERYGATVHELAYTGYEPSKACSRVLEAYETYRADLLALPDNLASAAEYLTDQPLGSDGVLVTADEAYDALQVAEHIDPRHDRLSKPQWLELLKAKVLETRRASQRSTEAPRLRGVA